MAKNGAIGIAICMPSMEESKLPVEKPFPSPSDVNFASGEGASETDLRRGYIEPTITSEPKYDLNNYKQRFTAPNQELRDRDGDNYPDDWEFQNKDRESRGFLTRTTYER